MRSLPSVFAALLLASVVFAQEYQVDVSPVCKVGSVYAYAVHASDLQEHATLLDGQKVKAQKIAFTVDAEGLLTVLAVSADGAPTEVKLELRKFEIAEAEGVSPVFKPGDLITCGRDAKGAKSFTVNGAPASQVDKPVLDALLSVRHEKLPDEQAVFGPKKPVAEGEEWEIDGPAALAGLAEAGLKAGPDSKAEGRFRLEKVAGEGDQAWYQVAGGFACTGLLLPMPSGMAVKEFSMEMKGSTDVPASGAGHIRAENNETVFRARADGEIDAKGTKKRIEVQIDGRQIRQKTWTPEG